MTAAYIPKDDARVLVLTYTVLGKIENPAPPGGRLNEKFGANINLVAGEIFGVWHAQFSAAEKHFGAIFWREMCFEGLPSLFLVLCVLLLCCGSSNLS